HDRLRAFFRRDGKVLGHAHTQGEQAAAVVAETRGYESGMQAVGSHTAFGPSPSQLTRVKNVAELGTSVNLEAAVVVGRLQVAEVQPVALVRVGRSVDHARRRRSPQALAQAVGDHEVRHVVGGKGELQAVGGELARAE